MRVTVAIPCYNEAPTIGKVVADFRARLPEAEILVCDNDSCDGSAELASRAGARVIREQRRGKGFAVKALFEAAQGDVCVLVDGDDTYFAEDVHVLVAPILEGRAEMVVGNRLDSAPSGSLTELRRLGNRVIPWLVNRAFQARFTDVLSGYRALSRGFLRDVAIEGGGFEIETELALGALESRMRVVEVPVRYRVRPAGSFSKLSPVLDGVRIVRTLGRRLRRRPGSVCEMLALGLLVLDLGYAGAWGAGFMPASGPRLHGWVLAGTAAVAAGLVMAARAFKGSTGAQRGSPPATG